MTRSAPALFLALCAAACGGHGGGTPTAPQGNGTVAVTLYYDENANGVLDAGETGRVPGVEVQVGARRARTAPGTGRADIGGVPPGAETLVVNRATLPAFYLATTDVSALEVPPSGRLEVQIPLTLPVGSNRPDVYMAFGDSITLGDQASDGAGYRSRLQEGLRAYFGAGEVVNEGVGSTESREGVDRIARDLDRVRPAYTVIVYGTNDWNHCREVPCFTVDSVRTMIRECRARRSLPFVATILPVNTALGVGESARRNEWVVHMNQALRPAIRAEGAVLVDLHAAFTTTPDMPSLFFDYLHPNDRGYQLIADTFLSAIGAPAPTGP